MDLGDSALSLNRYVFGDGERDLWELLLDLGELLGDLTHFGEEGGYPGDFMEGAADLGDLDPRPDDGEAGDRAW